MKKDDIANDEVGRGDLLGCAVLAADDARVRLEGGLLIDSELAVFAEAADSLDGSGEGHSKEDRDALQILVLLAGEVGEEERKQARVQQDSKELVLELVKQHAPEGAQLGKFSRVFSEANWVTTDALTS